VINHGAGTGVSKRGAVQVVFVLHIYDIVGFREDCGVNAKTHTHCNKDFAIFPSPAGMSPIEISQDVKNLIIPGQGEFGYSDIPFGEGKIANLFFTVALTLLPTVFKICK
jgi:hypothetical protein